MADFFSKPNDDLIRHYFSVLRLCTEQQARDNSSFLLSIDFWTGGHDTQLTTVLAAKNCS